MSEVYVMYDYPLMDVKAFDEHGQWTVAAQNWLALHGLWAFQSQCHVSSRRPTRYIVRPNNPSANQMVDVNVWRDCSLYIVEALCKSRNLI